MAYVKSLSLGFLAACLVSGLLGCSSTDKQSSSASSSDSATASSSSSIDQLDALKKENEALKKKMKLDGLVSEGRKALDDKRYDVALKTFDEALDLDPDDSRAQRGRADAKEGLKNAGDTADKDKQFALYMKTGREAMDNKEYASAVRNFQLAVDLRKTDEEAFKALDAAKKALDTDDNEKKKLVEYQAQIDAGDKLMVAGNYKDALGAYNKALALAPGDPIAKKKVAQAEKRLDDIARDKTDKDKYDSLITQGRRDLQDKHFDAAIKGFDQAKTLMPQEAEAPRLLKDAQDKKKLARADYDAAMLKGNVSLQSGMFEIANGYYDQAALAYPDLADQVAAAKKLVLQAQTNVAAYNLAMQAGNQALLNKMYDVAVAQFSLALQALPGDITATAALKEAKEKEKERKTAYEKAIKAGNQALDLKNYNEAIKNFEDALQIAPGDLTAKAGKRKAQDGLHQQNYDLAVKAGDAAMNAKNYKEAAKQYEIALGEKPGDFYATGKHKQATMMIK